MEAREVARHVWVQGRSYNGGGGGFKGVRSVGPETSNARRISAAHAVAIGAAIRAAREAAGLSRAAVDRALGLNTACRWWEGRMYRGALVTRPPSLPVWRRLLVLLPGLSGGWTPILTPTPKSWDTARPGPADFAEALVTLSRVRWP